MSLTNISTRTLTTLMKKPGKRKGLTIALRILQMIQF